MRLKYLSALLLTLTALLALAAPVRAQDGLAQMFNPRMGFLKPQFNLTFRHYGRAQVADSEDKMGWNDFGFSFSTPIIQSSDREWTANLSYSTRLLDHQPNLPLSQGAMPESLQKLKFGTGYRQKLENGWTAGGYAEIGSSSDNLFNSSQETDINLTAFVRIPHGRSNAWLVMLNFTNFRSFLPNMPFPGIAYWYQPSRSFNALIGVPMMINYMPNRQLRLSLLYVPIRSGGISLDYRISPKWSFQAGFRSSQDLWRLSDRPDPDRQLFYYDFKTTVGMTWRPTSLVDLNLILGYAFDRFYFEGHSYFDYSNEPLRLDNTWLVNLKCSIKF